MFYLSLVLFPLGNVDDAARIGAEALTLALQTQHVPTIGLAHLYTCALAAIRQKPNEAASHAETAFNLARERALPLWLAYSTFYRGWTRSWVGDRDGETQMREGLALLGEMDIRQFSALFGTLLAEVEAKAGRIEATLSTLDAQLAHIEQTGER